MGYFIDRRPNGKNKSTVNRQRFLRRYRKHIRKAVNEAVKKRSITDMERGEEVSIPDRDISEPVFQQGKAGRKNVVHPGNKKFNQGDRVDRPPNAGGGGGGSGSGASQDGSGEDEFAFTLTRDEFMDFLFDDLELPNLVRKELTETDETRPVHGGIVRQGTPSRLHVVRSMRSAYARRLAMGSGIKRELKECEAALAEEEAKETALRNPLRIRELEEAIEQLQKRLAAIPYLDDEDLRYRHMKQQPVPATQAVMLCIMDVSGSMTERHKELAKRFFLLLYLFLERSYKKVELVFIRHHTTAREVGEEEFFYSRETGGTIVSSALKLASSILEARYPASRWNAYIAQASDGDNWDDDSDICAEWMTKKLMPRVSYFAYVEITPHAHQALWEAYTEIQTAFPDNFAMRQFYEPSEIYPVFRELFQKERSS
ncbi:hypothetical protein SAMN05660443_2199 [Marinospirillum celere]|uniref:UPF0229 protein SAMN05660443_2199 n=1 Tax=Marinospirillum celere TaxID=1122252 RepID=A0A1I1I562_9GAMM|nr:YeaH/YhbH family protein [Marinospirillum celere]SFC31296.1 hypothetical protein SAMN05660443_2199 [Marinospirillum celere]